MKFHPDYNILQFSTLFRNSREFSQTLNYLLSAYTSLCYPWIKSYWLIENFYDRDAVISLWKYHNIYPIRKVRAGNCFVISRERTKIKTEIFMIEYKRSHGMDVHLSLIGLCVDRSNSSIV